MASYASPFVSRPALRRLIQGLILGSADFDAFCLDYFPDIYERFSVGMDRVSRINLLLELAESETILQCLRSKFGSRIETKKFILISEKSDIESHQLACRLEDLYNKKESLMRTGQDLSCIDEKIKSIKKKQRKFPQLLEGEVLGDRYRLCEIIGYGGFATVWQAFDRKLQILVAVKVLHSQWGQRSEQWARFERGARNMTRMSLQRPGFVKVLSDGTAHENGFCYFVMEYLPGGDLRKAVLNNQISYFERISAILDVGIALQHAHEQGLVHRDVKPQNILLDDNGEARLGDFDLVLVQDTTGGTRTGPLGSFIYAAPEELENANNVDRRADVYSLGMTTIFCLVGADLKANILRDLHKAIEQLDIPIKAKNILTQATAWERDDRFSTVQEYCMAIKEAMLAMESKIDIKSKKLLHKNWSLFSIVVSGLLIIFGFTILLQQTHRTHKSNLQINYDMINIPEGTFTMGSDKFDGEGPQRMIHVNSFRIDRTEVTLSAFRVCVDAGACNTPEVGGDCNWGVQGKENHPVNCVDWDHAESYCRWAKKRLPTEEEWEYSARGVDGREFPWGNTPPGKQVCWNRAIGTGTCDVNEHPNGQSPFGVLDMAGNVWEWTSTIYAKCYNPQNCPAQSELRVVRGGSWVNRDTWYLRSSFRMETKYNSKPYFVGFRCAQSSTVK